ncbi:MAG: hypothetical protein ABRQ39_21640 [Candidatus Eremiobacterota bacterium]
MSVPEFKLTPVKNFVTKEQFTELTETRKFQYKNLTEDLTGYDYLLLVNIGLTGENQNQIFIEGSFFNTVTEKPYGTFSRSYTRGAIEQFDIFVLNSITELEMYFSPFRKIIEAKELPVTGSITMDKNEIYVPGNEKITGTVSELLNKDGENIRDYTDVKVAVRLKEGSLGQINSEKNNWNIISPDEKGDLKFTYVPPEVIPHDGIKDMIELATFMYGNAGNIIGTSPVTLHKETMPSATPVSSQTPMAAQTPVIPGQIISGKNLMLNIGFTHYNYIYPAGKPRDKGQDYAEVLILADNTPLTGASLKVFSFEPGKTPPTSEILKDTLSGGVSMKEINDGYYCIGYVPVLGEFSPVKFYQGGIVILIIRYNGNLIGMKSFPVPSFSINMPEHGKTYPAGNKLKASLSSHDKNKNTIYNWYNYKIDRLGNRTGIELPAQSGTSVTYKPSTIEGKETDNILKIKASINGTTDILSPDGYWVYNISTIQEIWYRVKPSGEKIFTKWKYLKDEIKNRGIRNRKILIKQ